MRSVGASALAFTKDWFTNPVSAGGRFTDLMFAMADCNPRKVPAEIYQSMCCNSIIGGRWAMCGFPTVTLGHRTAAAFMATKIRPEDAAEFVRAPWPAFGIRLPPDILSVEFEGTLEPGTFIAVTACDPQVLPADHALDRPGQDRWWYKLMAPNAASGVPRHMPRYVQAYFEGISLWGFNVPTEFLAVEDGGASDETYERWDTHEVLSSDQRSDRLARAAILSTCLFLSGDPRERAERKSDGMITVTSRTSKQRDSDVLPPYTEYEVHSAIKINLHHAMRDYVRHGGSAPSVQTMAAGHWKRVAHGAAHSLRRMQYIAPYWRGPIDAPVSTRVK